MVSPYFTGYFEKVVLITDDFTLCFLGKGTTFNFFLRGKKPTLYSVDIEITPIISIVCEAK